MGFFSTVARENWIEKTILDQWLWTVRSFFCDSKTKRTLDACKNRFEPTYLCGFYVSCNMTSHYVSSFFKLSFQSLVSNTGRCEALVIPLCSDLQQNMTLFPNILNHRTQEEAALEVHQFFPLVKVGCSPYLAQFLCSVYAPPCEEPRQPCRELCNQAREGCEALMQRFGFTWPGILACNKFPTRHNGTNCIG